MRIVCFSLLMACGGGAPPPQPVGAPSESPRTTATRQPRDDGVEIEGLMGSLPASAANDALAPRMRQFLRCFSTRMRTVEVLGGAVRMSFRVARDGSVRWVFPVTSTVGDRQVERCLLDIASGVRFPAPQGGEAELSYPLEMDASVDVRPPVAWEPGNVADLVAENGQALVEECAPAGRGTIDVTAYVAPGGRVLAAGGAASDLAGAGALDCLTAGVARWEMPDPGSYFAKVTFRLR